MARDARSGLPKWLICRNTVPHVTRIITLIYLWVIAIKLGVDIILLIVHISLNGDSDYKFLVGIHALLLGLHTYLAIYLYMSVKSEKYGNLRCWFSTSIVVFAFELVIFVLEIYIQVTAEADEAEEAKNPPGEKKVNLQRVLRSPWEYFAEERIVALDAVFDVLDLIEILFHVYAYVIVYKFMQIINPDKKKKKGDAEADANLLPPLTPPIGEVTLAPGEASGQAIGTGDQRKTSDTQRRRESRLLAAKRVSQRFSLTKPPVEIEHKFASKPVPPTHPKILTTAVKVENETSKK